MVAMLRKVCLTASEWTAVSLKSLEIKSQYLDIILPRPRLYGPAFQAERAATTTELNRPHVMARRIFRAPENGIRPCAVSRLSNIRISPASHDKSALSFLITSRTVLSA